MAQSEAILSERLLGGGANGGWCASGISRERFISMVARRGRVFGLWHGAYSLAIVQVELLLPSIRANLGRTVVI